MAMHWCLTKVHQHTSLHHLLPDPSKCNPAYAAPTPAPQPPAKALTVSPTTTNFGAHVSTAPGSGFTVQPKTPQTIPTPSHTPSSHPCACQDLAAKVAPQGGPPGGVTSLLFHSPHLLHRNPYFPLHACLKPPLQAQTGFFSSHVLHTWAKPQYWVTWLKNSHSASVIVYGNATP